jgi:hypothetical protein
MMGIEMTEHFLLCGCDECIHAPAPRPFVPVNVKSEPDKVLDFYASELQRIYNKRTAGDYTFSGVLAEFLFDIKKAGY